MAMTVPFVGFNVINQAECAASHGVFLAIQVYAVLAYIYTVIDAKILRGLLTTIAFGIVGAVAFVLIALQLLGKFDCQNLHNCLFSYFYISMDSRISFKMFINDVFQVNFSGLVVL